MKKIEFVNNPKFERFVIDGLGDKEARELAFRDACNRLRTAACFAASAITRFNDCCESLSVKGMRS